MFQVIFCALKANPRQSDFFYFQKDLKGRKKNLFMKDGTTQDVLWLTDHELFEENQKKTHFISILDGTFMFQRSIWNQNDFSFVLKRPKEMQRTFLKKMGPSSWPERSTIDGS